MRKNSLLPVFVLASNLWAIPAKADMIKNFVADLICTEITDNPNPRVVKITSDEKNGSTFTFNGKTCVGETYTIGTEGGSPYTQMIAKKTDLWVVNLFPDKKTEAGRLWNMAFESGEKLENFSMKGSARYRDHYIYVEQYKRHMDVPLGDDFEVMCTGTIQSVSKNWNFD